MSNQKKRDHYWVHHPGLVKRQRFVLHKRAGMYAWLARRDHLLRRSSMSCRGHHLVCPGSYEDAERLKVFGKRSNRMGEMDALVNCAGVFMTAGCFSRRWKNGASHSI
jgi:hypothetical protein